MSGFGMKVRAESFILRNDLILEDGSTTDVPPLS